MVPLLWYYLWIVLFLCYLRIEIIIASKLNLAAHIIICTVWVCTVKGVIERSQICKIFKNIILNPIILVIINYHIFIINVHTITHIYILYVIIYFFIEVYPVLPFLLSIIDELNAQRQSIIIFQFFFSKLILEWNLVLAYCIFCHTFLLYYVLYM